MINCIICKDLIFRKTGAYWHQICCHVRWLDDCSEIEYDDNGNLKLYSMLNDVADGSTAEDIFQNLMYNEFGDCYSDGMMEPTDEDIEPLFKKCKELFTRIFEDIEERRINGLPRCDYGWDVWAILKDASLYR